MQQGDGIEGLSVTPESDDVLSGQPLKVFFSYALPWVLGMLMISSAGIVDAYFLGNYVGSTALAAITLVIPSMTLLFGVGVLLGVGGSVRAGKYMGEGKYLEARAIFTKSLATLIVLGGCVVASQYLFLDRVVELLGGEGEAGVMAHDYLAIMLPLLFFLALTIFLSYFVRVDNRPRLASASMFAVSIINIALDAWFVAGLGWGIAGAAWATGISYVCGFLVLTSHFVLRRASPLGLSESPRSSGRRKLRMIGFTRLIGSWREVRSACYNGISEFSNELSAGLVVFLFNRAILAEIGMHGVAALTVVNYLLFMTLILCFGFSDSLQPVISKNYGARKPERIAAFLRIAGGATLLIGMCTLVLLVALPRTMVGLFLRAEDVATEAVALQFVSIMWPVFVFMGINITASAYFTAMHRPLHSASIAIGRMVALPTLFLLTLPHFFGANGIFAAMPLAEICVFAYTIWLLRANKPSALVARAAA